MMKMAVYKIDLPKYNAAKLKVLNIGINQDASRDEQILFYNTLHPTYIKPYMLNTI